ncbi:transposase [Actinosynnema sp. CS-041913]|uniref:transposase n=1 Tax=Actinosynnema sp. CS-041913 TaxID=3239917 RepID=UPI003D8A253E
MAAPSAAVMDSQSVRAAETVGRATRGWDGGKKVTGRKRHIVVDTTGLLVAVLVTPASTQDRVAARSLLRRMRATAGERVRLVWVDGGYTGPLFDWARATLGLRVEVVQRPQLPYLTVLPRRWVVKRTLAWITGNRRCVRDYERLRHHHEAMVRWSMIRITSHRLTQPSSSETATYILLANPSHSLFRAAIPGDTGNIFTLPPLMEQNMIASFTQ